MSLVLEPRLLPGLAAIWRRCAAGFGDDGSPQDARSSRRIAFKLFAGIALLGAFWGSVIAVAGLSALYLCVSLIGCAFILLDFRVGVVLLILLMPISSSDIFPHAMLGITGLNPLNVLLAGTLGSYLLHGLSDGSLRRFMPRPVFWLYVAPILLAGALGSRHVGDIAPAFLMYDLLDFHDTAGYVRGRAAPAGEQRLARVPVGARDARQRTGASVRGRLRAAAIYLGRIERARNRIGAASIDGTGDSGAGTHVLARRLRRVRPG